MKSAKGAEGKKVTEGITNNKNGTGLYVHIPFCESKCRYCAFFSKPAKGFDMPRLVEALIGELDSRKGELADVSTVYIGGGSPSVLGGKLLSELAAGIRARCSGIEEFTVEVNPGQVDKGLGCAMKDSGVNRVSIGGQSFNQNELNFLGRWHKVGDIYRAIETCRNADFENLSLDLIFAICGQSLRDWQRSLDCAVQAGVEHISAYSLGFEQGTPLDEDRKAGKVAPIDEELDRKMYLYTIDFLRQAGIEMYEISNFAKPGFECIHNLNYWSNGKYIGIGPGAWSYTGGIRKMNKPDIPGYIEAMREGEDFTGEKERVSELETTWQTAVLNLRRTAGLNFEQFRRQIGCDAQQLFSQAVEENVQKGFILRDDTGIRLTREGLPVADSILSDFVVG